MNRQAVIGRPGGPAVLAVVERQIPAPGPGMARVRVLAAGVAYAGILMRKGAPQGRVPPGSESSCTAPPAGWVRLDRLASAAWCATSA